MKQKHKRRTRNLSEDCPGCHAKAGEPCRNYRGGAKQPCTLPAPSPAGAPILVQRLFPW
jgi:hypothetical protein